MLKMVRQNGFQKVTLNLVIVIFVVKVMSGFFIILKVQVEIINWSICFYLEIKAF